jgi:hypothetical protein
MILAEALRKIHDAGQVHGGVSPASIVLTGSGLQLLPAAHSAGTITPYTAPELLQGHAADSGSDIFAFGAVAYEMFSGRRAFEGDGPAALSAAINTSTPPSSGSPAVDRLISNCLAKDPAARWQRMQKILLELKLLTVFARRAEAPASVRREQAEAAALRAEMQQLEGRVAARLQASENAAAEIHQAATELRSELAATREQQVPVFEELLKAAEARITEHVGRLEQALDAARKDTTTLHESVSEDFLAFEQSLKSQGAAIESVRTAMAQTDDLVERVVEALELLQSAVLEPREDPVVAMQ